MISRETLPDWVVDALHALGGTSNIVGVAKFIWTHHEAELRGSGDLFYTWQYDIRWAAQKLRDRGRIKPVGDRRSLPWQLSDAELRRSR